jgi:hypothetical protein
MFYQKDEEPILARPLHFIGRNLVRNIDSPVLKSPEFPIFVINRYSNGRFITVRVQRQTRRLIENFIAWCMYEQVGHKRSTISITTYHFVFDSG